MMSWEEALAKAPVSGMSMPTAMIEKIEPS